MEKNIDVNENANEFDSLFLQNLMAQIPTLNEKQIQTIFTTEGPVQIIAGPGSGKTLVLVLRTLYLLMSEKAKPSEIVLTTFTEKADFELRDKFINLQRVLIIKGLYMS